MIRAIYYVYVFFSFVLVLILALGAWLKLLPADFVPFPVVEANSIPMALAVVLCFSHNFIFLLSASQDDQLIDMDYLGMMMVAGIGAITFASFFARYLAEGPFSEYVEYDIMHIIFGIGASFTLWALLFHLPLIIRRNLYY